MGPSLKSTIQKGPVWETIIPLNDWSCLPSFLSDQVPQLQTSQRPLQHPAPAAQPRGLYWRQPCGRPQRPRIYRLQGGLHLWGRRGKNIRIGKSLDWWDIQIFLSVEFPIIPFDSLRTLQNFDMMAPDFLPDHWYCSTNTIESSGYQQCNNLHFHLQW